MPSFLAGKETHKTKGVVERWTGMWTPWVRWGETWLLKPDLSAHWEQDVVVALCLLSLTHLPSMFPYLQCGKHWLGWWRRAQQRACHGVRANMLCLGMRTEGAWCFVPSANIKETKIPPGSSQAIQSLLGNYRHSTYGLCLTQRMGWGGYPPVYKAHHWHLTINSDNGTCELWLGQGVGVGWL